jgi:thymidine phosphorylase
MLMAIFFNSMTFEESFAMTLSMMNSGEKLNWKFLNRNENKFVDKHSTGGVGDKISLPLAPALAACGVKVRDHFLVF